MTHRTYQTRLKSLTSETEAALSSYAAIFSKAERTLFAQTFAQGIRPTQVHKSGFQSRFGLTARQYNAILSGQGKVESIKELRKEHIQAARERVKNAEKAVKSLERRLKADRKTKAATVDKTAFKLHHKKRRLVTQQHRLEKKLAEQASGKVSLCFGSRKLFHAQYNLEENGYKNHGEWKQNHGEWKRDWQSYRDRQFLVLGSKDETSGCQGCQLKRIEGQWFLYLRLPNSVLEQTGLNKHIVLPIELPFGEVAIEQALQRGNAISYRFLRDKKGWRVFISTEVKASKIKTIEAQGAIGVDINAHHLAVVEMDRNGNPINKHRINVQTCGKSTHQRMAVIGDAVKQLIAIALTARKPIVLEELDFTRKKRDLKANEDRRYNRMISSFAYRKIIEVIKARCLDHGIEVKDVNPAYTSQIGKHKFSERYGLTPHQGAALVIARRSQNYREQPNREDQTASWLPVRKVQEHVWSYWRKVSRQPVAYATLLSKRKQSRSAAQSEGTDSKMVSNTSGVSDWVLIRSLTVGNTVRPAIWNIFPYN
ncbi:IS200/IS605 family element transposase accessory protein TnpB [Maribrevibacterium harenarium]|uniref:IS200/IS605 family element transposase accessory protein TnpB n=1 Tax=Maribrevibacterium harenarium TaxID=2589817 RepID=A0A501WLI7_9GAMM|nr:IS200/IS605 family accessory protein TnpB-related protein [Maribrevibacterium harenarium]TPE49004.1 IS200/IS605 family element transposase accessory protein TnpB [Maribrevibacterium harenarium]